MKWQDGFALGNSVIDEEHRVLFELFGGLEAKLQDVPTLNLVEAESLISKVVAHVETHFLHEESMMQDLESMEEAEKLNHENDHALWSQRFQERLPALRSAATDQERRNTLSKILLVGKTYWAQHYVKFDKRLANFLIAKDWIDGGPNVVRL